MKLVARFAFPFLAFSCVGACSAESIDYGAEASPRGGQQTPVQEGTMVTSSEIDGMPMRAAIEETLAELTVGGQTLSFLQWGEGGEAVFVLRVSGASTGGSFADALERQAGQPLTFLELFRALAPADESPPPALFEAHSEQALALGRAGDEEVLVVATVDKLVPPPGVSACSMNLAFPTGFLWIHMFTISPKVTSSQTYLCVSQNAVTPEMGEGVPTTASCTQYTKLRQRVSMCDDLEIPTSRIANAVYGDLGGGWFITPDVSVPAGHYVWWEFLASGTSRRLAVLGTHPPNNFDAYALRAAISTGSVPH